MVLVYVDNILLTGTDAQSLSDLKNFLTVCFKIKDLGVLKYFLGIEVARSFAQIFITLRKYALDILSDSGNLGMHLAHFLMEWNLKLSPDNGDPLPDPHNYR